MGNVISRLWYDEDGQDIAEYAIMLAVLLVVVVGTVKMIASSADQQFSKVGSTIQ
jgi:Flp pilus assembly pilin Flp